MLLSLSILSANFMELGHEIQRVKPYIDRIHFDVMDGHFVKHISFGLPVLKTMHVDLPIDVHLMVSNPESIAEDYALYADVVYIHEESLKGKDIPAITSSVTKHHSKVGITLNPSTPIEDILPHLLYFSHVLIMSVEPGAGGQACIIEALDKISELKNLHPELHICVDGGMNENTAYVAKKKGADTIVSGSYLLHAEDPKTAASLLRN